MPLLSNPLRGAKSTPAGRRLGGASLGLIVGLLLVAAAATGGLSWYLVSRGSTVEDEAFLHKVKRGEFVLEVTERGELESAENVDIRCDVEQRSRGLKILEIVPEGTVVEKGDFLVRLDSAEFEQERIKQKIEVTNKQAEFVEAQNKLDAAKITLAEYEYGTFQQELEQIESEIFKAKENYNRALEYRDYTKKLAAKGFVSQQELEADIFAAEAQKQELAMANTKKKVLIDYTKEKMLTDLRSAIKTAEAKVESAKESLNLEKAKLQELEDQIAKCKIFAPSPGIVKYPVSDNWRDSDRNVIEEGAEVRQRQLLIQLPNPASMQVEMKVNESVINRIKEGMPARISIVGLRNANLPGRVSKVSQYSEPTNWRRGGVKEFSVKIDIEGGDPRLRTGMTAQVTVECLRKPDVLQAPVQAIYARGKNHYCVIDHEGVREARPVELGVTNDKFVVIEKGLKADEVVTLSPDRFFEGDEAAKEGTVEVEQVSGKEKRRQGRPPRSARADKTS